MSLSSRYTHNFHHEDPESAGVHAENGAHAPPWEPRNITPHRQDVTVWRIRSLRTTLP